MSASPRSLLVRLGRWPRWIAATACLLLAAGTALTSRTDHAVAGRSRSTGIAGHLRRGQVAVPVAVRDARNVHVGDHVGVLAAPTDGIGGTAGRAELVADQLLVLDVAPTGTALGTDDTTSVTVRTTPAGAVRIAGYATRVLLVALDSSP